MATLVIIDKSDAIREGIKSIVEKDKSLHILAEGRVNSDITRLTKLYRPDVVMVNIDEDVNEVIALIQQVMDCNPRMKFIALTNDSEHNKFIKFINLGIGAYLVKKEVDDNLNYIIQTVNKGEMFLYPNETRKLLYELESAKEEISNSANYTNILNRPIGLLTKKEYEVLQLLTDGGSTRVLSKKLSISEKTIKNHINAILRKLEKKDRTQAVVYGIKQGLVELR